MYRIAPPNSISYCRLCHGEDIVHWLYLADLLMRLSRIYIKPGFDLGLLPSSTTGSRSDYNASLNDTKLPFHGRQESVGEISESYQEREVTIHALLLSKI